MEEISVLLVAFVVLPDKRVQLVHELILNLENVTLKKTRLWG